MVELVYGIHAVTSILSKNPKKILKVFIICKPRDLKLELLFYKISKLNINIRECSRKWLNVKTVGAVHQGIVAEIKKTLYLKEDDLLKFLKTCNTIVPLLLILDGVTDPHNLGACLRAADAAGVHMVIIPRNRSASVNATVRKVSSGAVDNIPIIRVTNLSRTLKLIQKYNISVIGTVLNANQSIFNTKLVNPLALVMGSEEYGIRHTTIKNCDELINIPTIGSTVSLNISVATGICLFEILRQRMFKNNCIDF